MKKIITPLATLALLTACGDDTDPMEMVNEEEVITTVNLTFSAPGESLSAQWRDADGPGGADPVITGPGPLTAGTTYTLGIELLNETEMPAEDITEEIREEAEEHQFFFTLSGLMGTVTVTDQESDYGMNAVGDDLPVGLAATLTSSAGTGALNVVLKHLPPVGGTPVKTAATTSADGESDVDVTFDLTVQ